MVIAVAWSKGGRPYMQDAFLLGIDAGNECAPDFFGICDGHGKNGENIARYVAKNIGQKVYDLYEADHSKSFVKCCEKACIEMDKEIRSNKRLKNKSGVVHGGSTCHVIFMGKKELYSLNLGDTRAIQVTNGRAVAISRDHKPQIPEEFLRIRKAGGVVTDDSINGRISVSRAFGDFVFKDNKNLPPHKQLMTCIPDVRTITLNQYNDKKIDFIVLASDGLWDVMTNDEAASFILRRMYQKVPLKQICQEVIHSCWLPADPMTGYGSDNVTIIIAVLEEGVVVDDLTSYDI